MRKQKTNTHSQTLSVGQTAKRLDISPDSVRNYCERGWLECIRGKANHRRILLRSIEAFEAQRRPPETEFSAQRSTVPRQSRPIDEDFEIYYLGNDRYPNNLEPGYICNLSFFVSLITVHVNPSLILTYVGTQFGGGSFKILRVRDAEVISERIVSLPGPTKDDVIVMRQLAMDR